LQASETFTKTINDLENLLSEALYIAHKATEKEDTVHSPAHLEDALVLLHKGDGGVHSLSVKMSTDWTGLRRRSVEPDPGLENAYEGLLSGSGSSISMPSGMDREGSHNTFYKESSPGVSAANRSTTVEPVALSTHNSVNLLRAGRCSPPLRTVELVPNAADSRKGSSFGRPPEESTLDKVNLGRDIVPTIAERTTTGPGSPGVPGVLGIRDGNADPTCRSNSESTSNFNLMIGELHDQKSPTAALGRLASIPLILPHASTSPEIGKISRKISSTKKVYEEDNPNIIKVKILGKSTPNKREVREFIRVFHQPPIQPRGSSLALRKHENLGRGLGSITSAVDFLPSGMGRDHTLCSVCSTDGPHDSGSEVDFSKSQVLQGHNGAVHGDSQAAGEAGMIEMKGISDNLPQRHISGRRLQDHIYDRAHRFNLRGKSHISLTSHQHFSLSRSHHRQPIARDWSPSRKRFAATVSCISTALIGTLIGIYAGEVPSIQYYIADFYHWALLGNVFMFIGLAISNFLFWPLPLLYGRKPYVLAAMTIAMPLLFPQALVVGLQRSPYVIRFRFGLILSRAVMGFALGFANMNFMATLTDLFGASLQSGNPHQEIVDVFDVRRHGGGMGVWLGIWTWCYMGSIGVGFLIGAVIINTLSPDWGFYVSIVIIAAVLFLNVLTPEVRRSAYRRSVTEVRTDNNVSRRLARGEVKMHRVQTGPIWWGEEFYHGILLSLDMVRQPGFLLMAFYVAWIYGQIVLVIVVSSQPFIGISIVY
jgi:MFS family permease